MNYGISLSTEAQHRLATLPAPVRETVFQQLNLLGEYPTTLSIPSRFPWREKCQRFPFDVPYGGMIWEVSVLFQYGQDEQALYILSIGVSKVDPNDL